MIVFDIETGGSRVFPITPDFIRIVGYKEVGTGGISVTTRPDPFLDLMLGHDVIVGHNMLRFDLPAVLGRAGKMHLIHELAAAGRLHDTKLVHIVEHPPMNQLPEVIEKETNLDRLGEIYAGEKKLDYFPALAKEYGGFDKIPVTDRRYQEYCAKDVSLTHRIARQQHLSEYAKREHRVVALATQMMFNGFRVDVPLIEQRMVAADTRRAELIDMLRNRYDLPTHDAKGKPRKAPHRTTAGKDSIRRALEDAGVDLRFTPRGDPAMGKDVLGIYLEETPEASELINLIKDLNGVRPVYHSTHDHTVNGRVHPRILPFQATGRWSTKDPGMTVYGKRGVNIAEREIFLPDEGHVLLACDLSQIDARAVAAHAQDPGYLDLFEPGKDSHTEVALAIWGTADMRQSAKIIGHGWNYGMGLDKLAKSAGSDTVAREFDAAMREKYPTLVRWKRDIAEEAARGPIFNGFGRRIAVDPRRAWTQGPAAIGQSSARDLMMECLLRLDPALYPGLRAMVHDEIVMSVPIEDAEEAKSEILRAFNFEWAPKGASRAVKVIAQSVDEGPNWRAVYGK